ncbi:MAG: site-2 protease family protein [Verrucomicrobiales bacterium]|nr:site-2 protease family protein [Verrucomicrobiales bacterium]
MINMLLTYICLLIVITFHEFAHAWVAWKCGDPTAKSQGRVSLNPVVHMDPIGTVALPLLALFLVAADSRLAGFIIGWGRPVPVNPFNLTRRRLHDTLISMAGPAMNVVLAFAAIILAKVLVVAGQAPLAEFCIKLAVISLFLCFFNLLPIPPLDGSHVLQHAIGMSDEQYLAIARYGFLIVILLIQIPAVRTGLALATSGTLQLMASMVGLT